MLAAHSGNSMQIPSNFVRIFFSLPEDYTVHGNTGNTLNTILPLNFMKKERPAL